MRKHKDFKDVLGQEHVKRGLEVAAAGGHNVLLIGPPKSGKRMMAERFTTILPEMTTDEAVETEKLTGKKRRLFRSPHHTISDSDLMGSTTPGEISLAHNGVLFLNNMPEFHRHVLECLRQPMEDGSITISRVSKTITHLSRFTLIASMNPCPCGYFTDPRRECHCTPYQIQSYLSKIAGPILDKIDIHLEVPKLKLEHLSDRRRGEESTEIRVRVEKARAIQTGRGSFNACLEPKDLEKYCIMDKEGEELLKLAILELGISARAYDKILKVAKTIADLDGKEIIEAHHISEAISYRSLDRNLWG